MYNGIGLQTPRGSGTNGHVQKNVAVVRRRQKFSAKDDLKCDQADRKPNKEILDHSRRRKIELKVAELESILEEQGYTPEEIEAKAETYRTKLQLENAEQETLEAKLPQEVVQETHHIAEANQQKNKMLRDAFGISEFFVEGTSLDPERREREAQLKKAIKKYEWVRTPSPAKDEEVIEVKEKEKKKHSKQKKKSKKHKKDKHADSEKSKKEKKKKKKVEDSSSDSESSEESDDSDSSADSVVNKKKKKFSKKKGSKKEKENVERTEEAVKKSEKSKKKEKKKRSKKSSKSAAAESSTESDSSDTEPEQKRRKRSQSLSEEKKPSKRDRQSDETDGHLENDRHQRPSVKLLKQLKEGSSFPKDCWVLVKSARDDEKVTAHKSESDSS